MVPADVRILSAKDLFVMQSSLTGESFPVEKFDVNTGPSDRSAIEFANLAFVRPFQSARYSGSRFQPTSIDTKFFQPCSATMTRWPGMNARNPHIARKCQTRTSE